MDRCGASVRQSRAAIWRKPPPEGRRPPSLTLLTLILVNIVVLTETVGSGKPHMVCCGVTPLCVVLQCRNKCGLFLAYCCTFGAIAASVVVLLLLKQQGGDLMIGVVSA